jgi:hypothetical protein
MQWHIIKNSYGEKALKMSMVVFWVVTLCGHVDGSHLFGGLYCLHLQLQMEAVCFSELSVPTYKSIWCHNPEHHHGPSSLP